MEVIQRLVNYIRQVEFTTETIKSQINENYNKYSQKIFGDLNNIYSTIAPDIINLNFNIKNHHLMI